MDLKDIFVLVAPDCPVAQAVIPVGKEGKAPSIHVIQYGLLSKNPYLYTHESLIYETHVRHKQLENPDKATLWAEFFSKNHACMRASALPKKFGWGVHYDHEGKIALYAMESPEYKAFAQGKAGNPDLVYAMRSKRV